MRTVTINRSFFNIPSEATVTLFECDKYGNALGVNSATIGPEATVVSINSSTNAFKASTSDILARYALYMLHVKIEKNTQKIPLFIFDGEGELTLSDLTSPIHYESIFNVMSYTGEDLPIVLQDCIEKLDTWFSSSNKNIFPQGYSALILTYVLYADLILKDEKYIKARCLNDFDVLLANYKKEL